MIKFNFCYFEIKVGDVVQLYGLKTVKYNGLKGTVIGKGKKEDRWNVDLGGIYGTKAFRIKNMKVLQSNKKNENHTDNVKCISRS